MERWAGRVALVTGASSGIGEQVAADLAKAGMQVVAVARREDRLQALKQAAGPGRVHALQADLGREGEVRRVFQWIEDNLAPTHGPAAVVINNAAQLVWNPLLDAEAGALEQLVAVNLTATLLSCREAIAAMKQHDIRDGHIININSICGHKVLNIPHTSMTAYTSSKHGLTALSQGLRFDIQKIPNLKTRVTSISPGAVLTDMVKFEEFISALAEPTLLLNTADISSAVQYVLGCPQTVEITELTIQPTGELF